MNETTLEMVHISKTFVGGVKALQDVTFRVEKGSVHGLVGENGAGKSTLMKILDGVYRPDEGTIRIDGEPVVMGNTRDAAAAGISLIFQELNLVPTLSAVENAFLGRLTTDRFGFVKWKEQRRKFVSFLDGLDFALDVDVPVGRLSIAEKQMVEIAKALLIDSKILVMDEPTATLTSNEIDKLFNIIRNLERHGITVIYISHRLEEIFQICQKVTVLRDGRVIDTTDVSDTSRTEIIEKMVGRKIDVEFPPRDYSPGDAVLEVKDLFTPGFLRDISFSLRKGEILGISGLVGSGRTEVARAIFGADKVEKGTMSINGRNVKFHSTVLAKHNSLGLVPEDRKEEGLAVDFNVSRNISVTNLSKVVSGKIFLNRRKEQSIAEHYVKELGIKTPSIFQKVQNLSGGNQQKVVLSKWLHADADILILDEPTRGIDVGAKFEIYVLMNELVKRGKSIIMISSELPEIFALSDRILVMHEGRLKGCVDKDKATPEILMEMAIG